MEKEASKELVEKIISSLNWDDIFEVNRQFKRGIGEGSDIIPGLKRKPFDSKITKSDFKSELRSLLKHVISNNIPEFFYGNWIIIWSSPEEWEFRSEDSEEDDPGFSFFSNPSLEVLYAPQRIYVTLGNDISIQERGELLNSQESDLSRLESMLEDAVSSENYELASKLRELINFHKNASLGDK